MKAKKVLIEYRPSDNCNISVECIRGSYNVYTRTESGLTLNGSYDDAEEALRRAESVFKNMLVEMDAMKAMGE